MRTNLPRQRLRAAILDNFAPGRADVLGPPHEFGVPGGLEDPVTLCPEINKKTKIFTTERTKNTKEKMKIISKSFIQRSLCGLTNLLVFLPDLVTKEPKFSPAQKGPNQFVDTTNETPQDYVRSWGE